MYKPLVTVKEGKIRGVVVKSVLGPSYIAFHEIPFAASPTGKLRFKDPLPPALWTGIRNATVCTGKICTQAVDYPPYNIIGEEDCLYLNVYTNSLSQSKPVMFWIHGGGFVAGTASYRLIRPDYLLEKDVVIVAANYRLGAFGFLNLGHRDAPGNQGLKDLIVALQWVKQNIAKFGGDPNNVTIFGQSAGGVLAHALTVSPKAKGLFHKTILQSGFLTCPWGFDQSRPERGFKLASLLGIKSTDPEEVVEMLRKLSDKDITKATSSILTEQEMNIFNMPFGVNYDEIAENPVLPAPIEQLWSNDINIPIMSGLVSYEGIMFFYEQGIDAIKTYNYYLPEYVKILGDLKNLGPTEIEELFQCIKDRYFNGKPITTDKLLRFMHFITDIYFGIPLKLYIEDRVKRTSTPNYVYRFSYFGKERTFTDLRIKRHIKGASHMDELAYLFYSPLCKAENPEPPASGTTDRIIIERLTTLWTNFAKTGNPTPSDDNVIKTSWKSTTKDEFHYLAIDEELELLTKKSDLSVNLVNNLDHFTVKTDFRDK
ncbi:esterase FE4-like [Colletes gigas]|uniref:esterase FE4-like n=1 Tax=Colletes gigas TaxID=935657 RepID=UPI001C9AD5EA|nr:esterase FE4-like [Colletes gigas]